MIRIVLNGTDLDLSETSLRWESVNTLFEENIFQSDYSFPFILKYSPVNMNAFGFAHKAEVPVETVKFTVALIIDGISIQSTLVLNGAGKNGFNANVSGGISGLLNADKKLSELTYAPATNGVINLGASFINMPNYKTVDWTNAIAFPPHYNPAFYGDANPEFNGVVNRMNATTGNYLTNTALLGNKYCFVPFLYIHYILKTIAAENGLTLTGDYWNDPELATALLYNNYAMDAPGDQSALVKTGADTTYFWTNLWVTFANPHYVSPSTAVIVPLSDTYSGCSNAAGHFHNADYKYYIPVDGDYAAKFTVKIRTTASYYQSYSLRLMYKNGGATSMMGSVIFLAGTSGVLTLEVLGVIEAAVAGATIYADIINNSGTISFFGSMSVTIKPDGEFSAWRYDLAYNEMDTICTLKNHVPDITVSEFLKAIKNFAQVEINPNWATHTLSLNLSEKTITGTPSVDLTALADPNPEILYDSFKKGYVLSYDFGGSDALLTDNFKAFDEKKLIGNYVSKSDLPATTVPGNFAIVTNINKVMQWDGAAWVVYSDNNYNITIGDASTERIIELAPLLLTDAQTNEGSTANDQKCIMPAISETGSSPMFDLGTNTPSLRTVFFRGVITPGTYGGLGVYASSTNYDVNANQCGNYNLALTGLTGWYVRFMEKLLLAIYNSAIFEYLILLPASYLQYKGKIQIKNVNYIVKNVSMTIGSTIKQSVVRLLKL